MGFHILSYGLIKLLILEIVFIQCDYVRRNNEIWIIVIIKI